MMRVKSLVPAPLRAVYWRYRWLRHTDAFRAAPLQTALRFLRWTARELFQQEFGFETPRGERVRTMRNNFTSLSAHITGWRDPEIQSFIARRVPAGGTFVDLGANIGIYSLFAAGLVGPTGKVIAVEAHPYTYGFLSENLRANGFGERATALHRAVGDSRGSVQIEFNAANPGETHVGAGGGRSISVPMAPLDELLGELGSPPVDYIKVDVEGFELPVLRGATETLRHNPRIAVRTELIDRHASRYGARIEQIRELFTELGMTPHRISADGQAHPVGPAEPLQGD